jgi:hypothetical protein
VVAIRTLLAVTAMVCGMVLSIPVILFSLPFWAVAFLTRVLPGPFEARPGSWQDVIEFDPAIGWRPKKNLNAYCGFEAGTFHVKTDSQGWPGKASIAESKVIVFGDSYAFGFGVNAKELFSELNPKLSIKAIGAPGYNMVQQLILMHQLQSQLSGKLVVWFVYIGNDLWDNLQPNMRNYRMPFVRQVNGTSDWEIVTNHIKSTKWLHHFIDNLRSAERFAGVFKGTTFLSHRMYSACEFLIGQGRDVCNQAGGRLLVMTIPSALQLNKKDWQRSVSCRSDGLLFDPNLPDQRIREICSKLRVCFAVGKEFLDVHHYIPGEGHWNERGHQRIADVLSDLYHEHALMPKPEEAICRIQSCTPASSTKPV